MRPYAIEKLRARPWSQPLRLPGAEGEVVWEVNVEEADGSFEVAGEVAAAGEVVGDERVTGGETGGGAVAALDFEDAAEDGDELAPGRVVPVLRFEGV